MASVLVIGDVIDDIIVVPKEPIRTNTDTDSTITQTLGGSASNIASWAASLGADVTFVGCVNSKDEFRVTEQFASYKVKTILQLSDKLICLFLNYLDSGVSTGSVVVFF